MSSTATRAVAEDAYSDQANWTLTDDLPTPPFPDSTIIIFLTLFSRCEMRGFMRCRSRFLTTATTAKMASVTEPLLDTIEADDPAPAIAPTGNIGIAPTNAPSNRAPASTTPADLEAG